MKIMESLTDRITNRIKRGGRESFFASSDFCDIANDTTVRQTLRRLEKKEMLVKIDQGLWYYPASKYGVTIEECKPERIADELKRRYGIHSARVPLHLLLELGIDTESLPYYFTSGPTRKVNWWPNVQVVFQHTSDQTMFAISSCYVCDIYISLKIIGQKNITGEQISTLKSKIAKIPAASISKNSILFKTWMRKIIQQ